MTEQLSRQDAFKTIETALQEHGSAPPSIPTHLNLKGNTRVTSMVSLFQPRELDGRKLEGERHIANLKDAIGSPTKPNYLDPLTVWWGGDRWYVVDGHHRRHAYLQAGVHKGIPVTVFQGTLEEALAYSVEANSKDRLPMTLEEKLDRAWLLTVYSGLSISRVCASCAIAHGTVEKMRKHKKELKAAGKTEGDLMALTWREAQDTLKGIAPKPKSTGWRAQMVRDFERRLRKNFGQTMFKNADIFAAALSVLDKRFPMWLMESEAFSGSLEELIELKAAELEEAAQQIRNLQTFVDARADY